MMKLLCTVSLLFLLIGNVFPAEGFKAGEYSLRGTASDGATLDIYFSLDDDGTVSTLEGDLFYFIKEFWWDEQDAIENQGYYKKIPRSDYLGKCFAADNAFWHMNCVITIRFTDEEVTTLMIHFEDNFSNDLISGAFLESHGDQAMQLYQKSFEFLGSRK